MLLMRNEFDTTDTLDIATPNENFISSAYKISYGARSGDFIFSSS